MVAATEAGVVIFPRMPAFYARPRTLEDMVDHAVARLLDLFDLDTSGFTRWGEPATPSQAADA